MQGHVAEPKLRIHTKRTCSREMYQGRNHIRYTHQNEAGRCPLGYVAATSGVDPGEVKWVNFHTPPPFF